MATQVVHSFFTASAGGTSCNGLYGEALTSQAGDIYNRAGISRA